MPCLSFRSLQCGLTMTAKSRSTSRMASHGLQFSTDADMATQSIRQFTVVIVASIHKEQQIYGMQQSVAINDDLTGRHHLYLRHPARCRYAVKPCFMCSLLSFVLRESGHFSQLLTRSSSACSSMSRGTQLCVHHQNIQCSEMSSDSMRVWHLS